MLKIISITVSAIRITGEELTFQLDGSTVIDRVSIFTLQFFIIIIIVIVVKLNKHENFHEKF